MYITSIVSKIWVFQNINVNIILSNNYVYEIFNKISVCVYIITVRNAFSLIYLLTSILKYLMFT